MKEPRTDIDVKGDVQLQKTLPDVDKEGPKVDINADIGHANGMTSGR